MIALEQARKHLDTLGLKQAVEALDNSLDAAASRELTYPEMLADLLGVEVSARKERYLATKTKMAHLPFQRTLEQFDFAFQPSIDERHVRELAGLAFVAEASNILLLGPPGVGKTHLAVALALRAIENGQGAYLRPRLRPDGGPEKGADRAQPGPEDANLPVAKSAGGGRVRHLALRREAATAFFTLVSARYERGSIILTSNKGFGEWGNCSATRSSPRRCWTGCCTTATCSTSAGRASGSGRNAKRGSSLRNSISPLRRRRPATTTRTDKVADQNQVGQS